MDGAILIIQLVAGVVCGIIASVMAANKGRSAIGWFFGGLFLGIIGIVVVAVLPNPKAEAAYRERVEAENRRLREQVRQERMKSETFRDYSVRRLDVHDQALGIDTRAALPPAEGAAPQLNWPADAAAPPPVDASAAFWYYEMNGEAKGPVSAADVRVFLNSAQISQETLVWCEGMPQWAALRTVPSLAWSQTI